MLFRLIYLPIGVVLLFNFIYALDDTPPTQTNPCKVAENENINQHKKQIRTTYRRREEVNKILGKYKGVCALSGATFVETILGPKRINVLHDTQAEELCVVSLTVANKKIASHVKTCRMGRSNCYFEIGFDNNQKVDIQCMPSQEFKLLPQNIWIPAAALMVGDVLQSISDQMKTITHIKFISKSLTVYVLEIENPCNFFVGSNKILTRGMQNLEALSAEC